MSRFLRPPILLPALAGFLLGVWAEVLASLITESGALLWGFLLLTASIVLLALAYRAGQRTTGRFGSPVTIRTLVDRYTQSQQGLIAVVSLYTPQDSPASALTTEARLTAAVQQDYDSLHLEKSNLKVLIAGIETHASRLAHCWLIATDSGTPSNSSLTYVPVIERYLREVKGVKCTFHSGPQYALTIEQDDALVAERARSLVNEIFEEAALPLINLPESKIVADITGGIRSITLGMILACLDNQRRVQFMGTHYDANGKSVGDLVPILFDYTAEIAEG